MKLAIFFLEIFYKTENLISLYEFKHVKTRNNKKNRYYGIFSEIKKK